MWRNWALPYLVALGIVLWLVWLACRYLGV